MVYETIIEKNSKQEFEVLADKAGENPQKCPKCSDERKKGNQNKKSFSYNAKLGVGKCLNCDSTFYKKRDNVKSYKRPEWENKTALSDKVIEWFLKRNIGQDTLIKMKVTEKKEWMPQVDTERNVICFNYFRDGHLINIKFRDSQKNFKTFKDAEKIFYNLDGIKGQKEIYIVEGEMDCLTMIQAGHTNTVSVPNGATKGNNNLDYLDNSWTYFENVEKVYITTDNDEPGENLGAELARRIGVEKCYRVALGEFKDVNEQLCKTGKVDVSDAKAFPIEGIFSVSDHWEAFLSLLKNGFPKGWKPRGKFGDLVSFYPGYTTVMVGIPGSGKSEVMDQVLIQISMDYNLRGGFFTPENWPSELHLLKLIEKIVGKSGFKATAMELDKSKEFLDDRIFWIYPPEGYGLEQILNKVRQAVLKYGINWFVIDPWNKLEHQDDSTGYVSRCLDLISNFNKKNGTHAFIVAHPTKMRLNQETGKYEVPGLYDISGCHDDKTEVLTENGWILHDDLNHENVACFNIKDNSISYQKPTKYHRYKFNGELIHFKGKSMDIMVTPNHRMVIKPSWGLKPETNNKKIGRASKYLREWNFIEAKEISLSPMKIPKTGNFKHKNHIPVNYQLDTGYNTNLLFELIGWYVSEGWETMGSFAICQADENSANLRRVLNDLQLKYTWKIRHYRKEEKPMFVARILCRQHPELAKYIINECGIGSLNKKLPDITWLASEKQKRLLFDSLIEGDGSIGYKGSFKYSTASKCLADDVSRLGFELGYKTTVGFYKANKKKWKNKYVVYISPKKHEWLMPVNHRIKNYNGFVYCLTVPTGAYVTRRNGKIAITGNSANFYNKADVGLCMYKEDKGRNTLIVQKVKFKFWGELGSVDLSWNSDNGRYDENGADLTNWLNPTAKTEQINFSPKLDSGYREPYKDSLDLEQAPF